MDIVYSRKHAGEREKPISAREYNRNAKFQMLTLVISEGIFAYASLEDYLIAFAVL